MSNIDGGGLCDVDECGEMASHRIAFTVASDVTGETVTWAWFCCDHFDRVTANEPDPPFVDVFVGARVRKVQP